MIKNVISVIDGEAGSCGKAKVVGEIATDNTINLGAAITNCMPNAGHTFVDEMEMPLFLEIFQYHVLIQTLTCLSGQEVQLIWKFLWTNMKELKNF